MVIARFLNHQQYSGVTNHHCPLRIANHKGAPLFPGVFGGLEENVAEMDENTPPPPPENSTDVTWKGTLWKGKDCLPTSHLASLGARESLAAKNVANFEG